jgi:curved DNA-binding protein CbpA
LAADPYQTLGVNQCVAGRHPEGERRLAKKLHPDLNTGNKRAEEQI